MSEEKLEKEIKFLNWLRRLSEEDSKPMAELRRSSAHDLGTYPKVFPYVEIYKFYGDWDRKAHYLVASLYALHKIEENEIPTKENLGSTIFKLYKENEESKSIEQRFITLLESDEDELAHRLRQMISLLKGKSIHWPLLLKHIKFWNDPQKRVQQQWGKSFYKNFKLQKTES